VSLDVATGALRIGVVSDISSFIAFGIAKNLYGPVGIAAGFYAAGKAVADWVSARDLRRRLEQLSAAQRKRLLGPTVSNRNP